MCVLAVDSDEWRQMAAGDSGFEIATRALITSLAASLKSPGLARNSIHSASARALLSFFGTTVLSTLFVPLVVLTINTL
ncbi:hypothetical protein BDQ12DRAFT_679724 [Crucibulum laeve]|uniref:Uncharacterized protein n=1 Tax=Crucibulum laeve TaxID=68775 RepID=A0A5C3M844_9AGAR|nr:hypothetical protein BDQ12DRAFT_679724 [Crucibulum laeve]